MKTFDPYTVDVDSCLLSVNLFTFFVVLCSAHVFEGTHQRAVNKLNYHPRETTLLISGSQDYTMNAFVSHLLL